MARYNKENAAERSTRKRSGSEVRMGFMVTNPKSARRVKMASDYAPEEPVRIPLTDADIARIDAICAEPMPRLTDHVTEAIERYRKRVLA